MMNFKKTPEKLLLGAILMTCGALVFPIGDSAAKVLSDQYSPLFVSWIRFAIGTLVLLPFALFRRSQTIKISKRLIGEQILRAVLIVVATVLFIMAIARIPLADTVGAYFTAPIIAALLAVFVLGEKISKAKIVATILGFLGMLLIVRPSASMEIGFIYALSAGLCFGCFLVATRWSICEVPAIKTVAFQTFFGMAVLTPFVIGQFGSLQSGDTALYLTLGIGSAVANILTISALRLAPASLLAPLVYFEIVGAVLLGFLIFGDIPSLMTIIGIVVVVIGGLVLVERKNRKESS